MHYSKGNFYQRAMAVLTQAAYNEDHGAWNQRHWLTISTSPDIRQVALLLSLCFLTCKRNRYFSHSWIMCEIVDVTKVFCKLFFS